MNYQTFLKNSLQEASQIANESFGKVSNTIKGTDSNQILTETDLAVGKLLITKIQTAYPDYNIIDEEAGIIDKNSEYTWVIDPIDGTSNFAHGVPTYGIMMGLLKNATPIAGGIVLPAFQTITIAEKGHGAFTNDKRIFVTKETQLLNTLVSYCIDGHQENPEMTHKEIKLLGKIVLKIRNLRSSNSAFDTIMVAQGSYGGLLNQTSQIWDNVAQQIIIEEAGGIYTDFWGESIDYASPLNKVDQNFTFCAAAPALHQQLQEIIHK